MLNFGAKGNLTFITAAPNAALTEWTLEFRTLVIKPLLTTHFTFHTSASCITKGKGQNIKENKVRQVVSFIAA